MSNLQQLYLRETQITDAGLVYLKGLTKLRSLSLTGTAELKKALPKCRIVR